MAYELKDFESQVLTRSYEAPVVVDFWAPWCGPCKQLGPVIEDLAAKAAGKWELVKVNTEDHPKAALDYEVTSIPDVRMFRNGQVVGDFKGFMPPEQIIEWINKHLPSEREDEIVAARQQAESGDFTGALAKAREILELEPSNEDLRLRAADWALRVEPSSCGELLAAIQDDSDLSDRADGLRQLAAFVADARQFSSASEKANAAFRKGLAALGSGEDANWIDQWIEAIERRKDFADGRLIQACKAAFRYLGARHPVVDANYRRFSSALY